MGLATAGSAALHAPPGVWIALLLAAGMCLIAAGLQHWREGRMHTNSDLTVKGKRVQRVGIDADEGSSVRTKRTKIRNQDTSVQLRGKSTHVDEDSEIE